MSSYASKTEVSAEKSRAEIETVLRRYGASAFSYGWDDAHGAAEVRFRFKEKWIRFLLAMPRRDEKRFHWKKYRNRYGEVRQTPEQAERAWEQACRSAWRSLLLVVKAKLEAVEHGISTFEYGCFAGTVLPNGQTVGEALMPLVDHAIASGETPLFLLEGPKT